MPTLKINKAQIYLHKYDKMFTLTYDDNVLFCGFSALNTFFFLYMAFKKKYYVGTSIFPNNSKEKNFYEHTKIKISQKFSPLINPIYVQINVYFVYYVLYVYKIYKQSWVQFLF